MTFWGDIFQEIAVTAEVESSTPLSEFCNHFIANLNRANLKVPIKIKIDEKVRNYDRPRTRIQLFGSASIFQGTVTRLSDRRYFLEGDLVIGWLFRLYFQIFLIMGTTICFLVFAISLRQWLETFSKNGHPRFDSLEVAAAGLTGVVGFIAFVELLAWLNYLSTKEQKSKIISAFLSAGERRNASKNEE